ncbi:MAG: hypothetical protein AMS14_04750 [Planctomycetes bacterium DG_20]|nr:MAG: hypothetical protein AMS14_04750 [Planctomycetes bacterium DG_20]
MRLDTEEGSAIDEPTGDQVREAVGGLGGRSGSFAILTRSDRPPAYLQTAGEADQFIIEYHEGRKHYRAEADVLPLEKVAALFEAYGRGDEAWREMVAWQDVTKEISGSAWVKVLILAVAFALAAVILYVSFAR